MCTIPAIVLASAVSAPFNSVLAKMNKVIYFHVTDRSSSTRRRVNLHVGLLKIQWLNERIKNEAICVALLEFKVLNAIECNI